MYKGVIGPGLCQWHRQHLCPAGHISAQQGLGWLLVWACELAIPSVSLAFLCAEGMKGGGLKVVTEWLQRKTCLWPRQIAAEELE